MRNICPYPINVYCFHLEKSINKNNQRGKKHKRNRYYSLEIKFFQTEPRKKYNLEFLVIKRILY